MKTSARTVKDGTIVGWRRGRVTFRAGDLVRVKVFPRSRVRIAAIYRDVVGGVRLDRMIAGFYSWNVADLVKLGGRP